MGLESERNALGAINPAQFAPTPAVVVEPRSVGAMQAAFAGGVDLANTFRDRAVAKPVIEAQAAMATDPQLLAAQKDIQLANAAQENLKTQADELALKQAQLSVQMPAQIKEMQKELTGVNWPVIPQGDVWTPKDSQEVLRRWVVSEKFKTEKAKAAAELNLVKNQEVVTKRGTELVPVSKNSGQTFEPSRVAASEQFLTAYQTPRDYDAAGQPQAPSLFGNVAPGTTATPGAVATGGAPAATGATGVPSAGGTIIKPPGHDKAPTEAQTKAANFVARATEANQVFEQLAASGYNPASFGSMAQSWLVGPLEGMKSDQKKAYDAASNAWIQGLLRLESGAAISAKEQSWYQQTFFPRLGDPASVQAQKERLRSDVVKVANTVANSGNLDVNSILDIRNRAETLSDLTNSVPRTGVGKVINIPGLGHVNAVQTPDGRIKISKPGAASSGGADSYQAPAKLGAQPKSSSLVEPRKGKAPVPGDEPMRELGATVEPKEKKDSINFGRLRTALGGDK